MSLLSSALIVLATTMLVACSDPRDERLATLEKELSALRTENTAIKTELEDLKQSPGQLLGQTDAEIERKDWQAAKSHALKLISRYSLSPEAEVAKSRVATIDATLAKAALEAEAEAARKAEVARARKAEEERRLAVALQKMSKKTDKVEGVDWYRDKSSPAHTNYNGFFVYLGKRASQPPQIRLRVQYNADDWLFIESFLIVADGKRFEYPAATFERDNDSEIWEWYDEPASESDLRMIRAVIESKEALMRLNGRQYRKDKPITAPQKAALRNVLDAYKALGGT
jgi:hypothetical protein